MFQCKDLFSLPSLSNIKLICGNDGVNNIIRWSYKAESIDLSNWVKGGELLIISGAVIERNDFNLTTLITESIELKLSGALLLVGEHYIKSIPKSLIKLCNTNNFPIFAIHWSTPLVNIFEELGHAIVKSNLNKTNEDFLSSIIFGNQCTKEDILLKGTTLNYNLDTPQKVFLIHFYDELSSPLNKVILTEYEIYEFISILNNLFNNANMNLLISSYGNNIIGLFSPIIKNDELAVLFKNFICKVKEAIPNLSLSITIGKTYSSAENIQKSFKEASKSMILAQKLKKDNNILFYDNLGIISLFCEVDRNDLLHEFSKQTLGCLIDYDNKCSNGKLLDTLNVYLENNCNIIKTSEELSTHRNTIKYRLHRIEEITNSSLDDPFNKLNLHNALLIHKFI